MVDVGILDSSSYDPHPQERFHFNHFASRRSMPVSTGLHTSWNSFSSRMARLATMHGSEPLVARSDLTPEECWIRLSFLHAGFSSSWGGGHSVTNSLTSMLSAGLVEPHLYLRYRRGSECPHSSRSRANENAWLQRYAMVGHCVLLHSCFAWFNHAWRLFCLL